MTKRPYLSSAEAIGFESYVGAAVVLVAKRIKQVNVAYLVSFHFSITFFINNIISARKKRSEVISEINHPVSPFLCRLQRRVQPYSENIERKYKE
jgi:hypothetical protein